MKLTNLAIITNRVLERGRSVIHQTLILILLNAQLIALKYQNNRRKEIPNFQPKYLAHTTVLTLALSTKNLVTRLEIAIVIMKILIPQNECDIDLL